MSHKKLRTEKQCLNCGHAVEDRFCSHCGQENLELNDSVTHLIIHYIQDLFHYDGKLWHTLKSLVMRPGMVAAEYMEGKRQRHLEPIRFYVFASTIFFLAFFFVVGDHAYTTVVAPADNYSKRLYNLEQEKKFLAGTPDTAHLLPLIDSLRFKSGVAIPAKTDTSKQAVDNNLPDTIGVTPSREGWLERFLEEKMDARQKELEDKYEGDDVEATRDVVEEIVHKMPQLIFLSLPFFAFFLKLLYWRARRSSYVEHFVFSIYHYAYLFTILLCYILMAALADKVDVPVLDTVKEWIVFGLLLYPFIYLLLSMKHYYADSWGKLIFRYIILLFLLMSTLLGLSLLLAFIAFLF